MDHSGLTWRKSAHSSNGSNGDCVEIARLARATAVRDSKNPDAGILTIPTGPWGTFVAAIS